LELSTLLHQIASTRRAQSTFQTKVLALAATFSAQLVGRGASVPFVARQHVQMNLIVFGGCGKRELRIKRRRHYPEQKENSLPHSMPSRTKCKRKNSFPVFKQGLSDSDKTPSLHAIGMCWSCDLLMFSLATDRAGTWQHFNRHYF
jgi:hypothetical protein